MTSHTMKGTDYQLAQINVADMLYNTEAPEMADFMNALNQINALAESSDGFVWRLKDDNGNATDIVCPLGDNVLINVSVWQDVAALKKYIYQSGHTAFLSRRKEWFTMPKTAHMALWWVPAGHKPTVAEAIDKLMHLREFGPTPETFTFKTAFSPEGNEI